MSLSHNSQQESHQVIHSFSKYFWASLVAQVVKNSPANAGDMGLIPGQEDPTCHGATEPVCHTTAAEPVLWSLGAATAEPVAPTIEVHAPYSQRSAMRSHRNEKPAQQ